MEPKNKTCPRCKETKDLNLFAKDNSRMDSISVYCKTCRNHFKSKWKKNNLNKVYEYEKQYKLNGPKRAKDSNRTSENKKYILKHKLTKGKCELCSYSKEPQILQFHHKDSKEKLFTLAHSSGRPLNEVITEIGKCLLLCPNCHAEQHLKVKITLEEILKYL